MKKVSELAMFTLFFSSLSGLGFGGCLLFLRYCPLTGEDSGMKIEYQDYGSVANIVVSWCLNSAAQPGG
jgi:hypothetical protein